MGLSVKKSVLATVIVPYLIYCIRTGLMIAFLLLSKYQT